MLSTILLIFLGSANLVLAGYPTDTYSAGYGFISNGGFGPHGHYLPAVARVKVHKDPFQSHYSLDEEGPTHYKYVRQSSSNHAIVHHPPPLVHHHHGHQAVGIPAAGIVGVGIGGIAPAAVGFANHHVGYGNHHVGYGDYHGGYGGGIVAGYPHAVGVGYGGIY
ncbi:unnamed protein product [Orchesella dallaii]|uniref:Uncharacterized protein n=1 Tax=Orchesella dallaii TaxID=48710 RepID=A0ABP1QG59_9HEXA